MCNGCNCDECWICGRRPVSVELESVSTSSCCGINFVAGLYVDGNDNFPNQGDISTHKAFGVEQVFPSVIGLDEKVRTVCESQWLYLAKTCQDESGTERVGVNQLPVDWTIKADATAHIGLAIGPHVVQGRDGESIDNPFDPDGALNFDLQSFAWSPRYAAIRNVPNIYAGQEFSRRLAVVIEYSLAIQAQYRPYFVGNGTLFAERKEFYSLELTGNCRNLGTQQVLAFRKQESSVQGDPFQVLGDSPYMNSFLEAKTLTDYSCFTSPSAQMSVKVQLPAV